MKSLLTTIVLTAMSLHTVYGEQTMTQTQNSQDPNPQARFGTRRSWNMYLTGEALWLKPLNAGYVGYVTSYNNTINTPQNYSFQNQTVDWKARSNEFQPAFRVALGYNTPFGGWDLALIYTRLDYKHNNQYDREVIGGNFTGNISDTTLVSTYNNGIYTTNIQGTDGYKLTYNVGDLDLGRMFKVSKRLKLRPHLGIRGVWLTQKDDLPAVNQTGRYFTNTNFNSSQISGPTNNYYKLKSTMIGLECGMDSLWNLSKQFSIYANVGLSSLVNTQSYKAFFDQFYTTTNYTQSGASGTPSVSSVARAQTQTDTSWSKTTRLTNNLDYALGLRWDMNFCNDAFHIGINCGYEHHTYYISNVTFTGYGIGSTDFNLQGISLGARFDF